MLMARKRYQFPHTMKMMESLQRLQFTRVLEEKLKNRLTNKRADGLAKVNSSLLSEETSTKVFFTLVG
jgi:hypothetical protein